MSGHPGIKRKVSRFQNRIAFSGALFLLVAAPLCSWAKESKSYDWPTHQGNQQRNAWTQAKIQPKQLRKTWRWQSPMAPQPAWHGPAKWDAYAGIRGLHSMRNYDPAFHPIAVGNRLWFASSADDTIRCVSAETGEAVWTFTADGPIRVAPTFADGRLLFGSDDGWAYCLRADDGQLLWKHSPKPDARKLVHNGRLISPWPVRSGVAVEDGVAYYAASLLPWEESYLVAIDVASGKAEGEGRYVKEIRQATFEGPLVVSPERLIAPQGRVAPRLFERKTGKDTGSLKGGGGSFVVLTPDSQIVHGPGNKTGWLTSSKPISREAIATFKQGNAIVVAGDLSFMLTDDQLVVSDWVKRKPKWTADCGAAYSLAVAGDAVYVGVLDAVLIFDAANGKSIRRLPTRGRVYGMAFTDNRLTISSDEGVLESFVADDLPLSPKPLSPKPLSPKPLSPKSLSPKSLSPKPSPPLATSDDKTNSSESQAPRRRPIEFLKDSTLSGRWVFQRPHADQRTVKDLAGKSPAILRAPSQFVDVSGYEALELNGQATIIVQDDYRRASLPKRQMTVEAWVRVDKATTWGGIVGAIQDNGSYERGWLLGFRDRRFCFALTSDKKSPKLTYLTETKDRELAQWRHVAGVYTGAEMRLYVDGQLAAKSSEQQGDILYPPNAVFEIGAYHDDNEYYRMEGAVHEVRVFRRALSASEIQRHASSKKLADPPQERVVFGPLLRFTSPEKATVQWRTKEPCPSVLLVDGQRLVSSTSPSRQHQGEIAGIRKKQIKWFQIEFLRNGEVTRTKRYECDNFFNYTNPVSEIAENERSPLAKQILSGAPSSQGIGVLVNPTDAVVLELAQQRDMRWLAVVDEEQQAASLRKQLLAAGRYGRSIVWRQDLAQSEFPLTAAFADIVVTFDQPDAIATRRRRLVRPGGRHLRVKVNEQQIADTWQRPKLDGAGSWSHLYGSADNSAFGGEALAGVTRSDQLAVQWIGRPGARYQPDRSGRKPSPLAVGGRLYLQGLERLIALNSFNGTILWSLEMPHLGRFNMPRDSSNWCADENNLYVAWGADLCVIDGESGKLKRTLSASQLAQPDDASSSRPYDWGLVARSGDYLIGSAVRPKTVYTEYWGNAEKGWYDARGGSSTFKVCSDVLLGRSLSNPKQSWRYPGVIVNSTVTIADRQVIFAESRNPKVLQSEQRRVGQDLNNDLFLVSLDLSTGKKIWEQKVEAFDGEVAFYVSQSKGRLALVGSAKNRYDVRVLDSSNGSPIWAKKVLWPSNNHGGHMSRPAIVGNALYVRPKAFELASGLELSVKMPMGGCGTYAATTETLLFRSRNVTMWDRREGGATAWTRLRPDCWLSTIPADGLLLSPEGGGGCSCGSWMETSLGFIPRTLLKQQPASRQERQR